MIGNYPEGIDNESAPWNEPDPWEPEKADIETAEHQVYDAIIANDPKVDHLLDYLSCSMWDHYRRRIGNSDWNEMVETAARMLHLICHKEVNEWDDQTWAAWRDRGGRL